MLSLLLTACLAQAAPRVAVVDVSAPDAIYGDVSRALADALVAQLEKAGVEALRIEDEELPEGGCRLGPCLGVLARAHQAQVVVMLDATEVDAQRSAVAVAAMASRNGQPVAVKKYQAVNGRSKPAPALVAFAEDVAARTRKLVPVARDGGVSAPAAP